MNHISDPEFQLMFIKIWMIAYFMKRDMESSRFRAQKELII